MQWKKLQQHGYNMFPCKTWEHGGYIWFIRLDKIGYNKGTTCSHVQHGNMEVTCSMRIFHIHMHMYVPRRMYITDNEIIDKIWTIKYLNELFASRVSAESTSHKWRRPLKRQSWKDWSVGIDCPHVCAQWRAEWGGRFIHVDSFARTSHSI